MDERLKLILSITLFISLFRAGIAWDSKRSKNWDKTYLTCTKGKNQSPIDLRANITNDGDGEPTFRLFNYTTASHKITIKNTGTAIELNGTWTDAKPALYSAVLFPNETYSFKNARLYWSKGDDNGTNHSIQGKKYTMELHLMHYNDKYKNLTDLSNYTDAAVMISVLYDVNDNADSNLGMLDLSVMVASVLTPNKSAEFDSLKFSKLLPSPVGEFYFYNGSNLTPPCSENVHWIVLAQPQSIISDVVYAFRSVKLNDDAPNIRALQSINNRIVEFFYK